MNKKSSDSDLFNIGYPPRLKPDDLLSVNLRYMTLPETMGYFSQLIFVQDFNKINESLDFLVQNQFVYSYENKMILAWLLKPYRHAIKTYSNLIRDCVESKESDAWERLVDRYKIKELLDNL